MKIIPLADRVVIKTVEVEETTKGGLILTGSAKEKPQVAQVVAVGPGGTPLPRWQNSSSATWTARATAQRVLRLRWTMFFTPASGIHCTVRSQRRDGCSGAVSRF